MDILDENQQYEHDLDENQGHEDGYIQSDLNGPDLNNTPEDGSE